MLDSIRKNKVAIKGPITTPVGTGFRIGQRGDPKGARPLRLPAAGVLDQGVRSALRRHRSGDRAREHRGPLRRHRVRSRAPQGARDLIKFAADHGAGIIRPDSGISLKPISITGTERIVRYAFDYAIANGRKKVTAVHKANILKMSDGLFLKVAREVAEEYKDSGIEFEDYIVDATCMQLVLHPEWWDVLVLPNLYGDIISDLSAGLIGGLGIAMGANIGTECAVFEPVHGSAPKYAGKDVANPTAEILSAMLMLKHLGETEAADRVLSAVRDRRRQGRDGHLRHQALEHGLHRRLGRHAGVRRRAHRGAVATARSEGGESGERRTSPAIAQDAQHRHRHRGGRGS